MRFMLSLAAALCLSAPLLLLVACNPEAFKGQANANHAPTTATTTTTTAGGPTTPPAAPPPPADNVRRITVDELKQELAANKALVVDVRGDAAYKTGHIKGSIMIPAAEIDQHIAELPKDKLIVTYCA